MECWSNGAAMTDAAISINHLPNPIPNLIRIPDWPLRIGLGLRIGGRILGGMLRHRPLFWAWIGTLKVAVSDLRRNC